MEMMEKMTAVEWLVEKLSAIRKQNSGYRNIEIEFKDLILQALEIEKEQIRVAYMEGAFEKMRHLNGKEFILPEQYYNETYNNEQRK